MVDVYNMSSHSKHPSFSSTLLDAIYRSIDDEQADNICGHITRRRKDQESTRDCLAVAGKVAVRPSGGGAGICASFDADASYGKRLKPIRVWDSSLKKDKSLTDRSEKKPQQNQDGFSKKNSGALKMYAGLKKVKQPISPGAARLAGFLNSLFYGTGKYSKKPTTFNNQDMNNSPILNSADSSTCSSASSFSRSCLRKTPSCRRGKPTGGDKRSVRFSPVSVIMNQNSQSSCGTKSSPKAIKNQYYNQIDFSRRDISSSAPSIDEQMLLHAEDMNNKVEEAARDLLRNYRKKMDCEFPFDLKKSQPAYDEESDEDDAASYASSDLFELDNLSAIGMERYELPVYETTRLPAIALIL